MCDSKKVLLVLNSIENSMQCTRVNEMNSVKSQQHISGMNFTMNN